MPVPWLWTFYGPLILLLLYPVSKKNNNNLWTLLTESHSSVSVVVVGEVLSLFQPIADVKCGASSNLSRGQNAPLMHPKQCLGFVPTFVALNIVLVLLVSGRWKRNVWSGLQGRMERKGRRHQDHWEREREERFPGGGTDKYSSDPTQSPWNASNPSKMSGGRSSFTLWTSHHFIA